MARHLRADSLVGRQHLDGLDHRFMSGSGGEAYLDDAAARPDARELADVCLEGPAFLRTLRRSMTVSPLMATVAGRETGSH